MKEKARVRSVVLCGAPRWLDAVERALAPLGIEVVARRLQLAQALAALDRHEPEVLIAATDAADGFAWVRRARERLPALKVIALVPSPEDAASALDAGASAAILTPEGQRDLVALTVREAWEVSDPRFLG